MRAAWPLEWNARQVAAPYCQSRAQIESPLCRALREENLRYRATALAPAHDAAHSAPHSPLMKNGIACTLVDHAREASCGGSRVQRLRMVLRGSVTQEHDFCRRIMEVGEGEKRPHGRTGDG